MVLSAYNFTMAPEVTAALEVAAKAGKGVVAMKIMAGGARGRGANNEKLKQPGALPAALRWVTHNRNIHTTVPSMTDIDQLDENIRAGFQSYSRPIRGYWRCSRVSAPVLLQYVRSVRGTVSTWPAGARRSPLPRLCRWLRAVRPGARALPGIVEPTCLHPLRGLLGLHGPVPAWRPGGRTAYPRAGTFRVLKLGVAAALVAGVLLPGVLSAAAPTCNLVPGWTAEGQPRVYTADNLFEYMDGNSEGYFLYHFQEMHGVTCKQGAVTFVIDISDMTEPDFAFGMSTSTRDLRHPAYPVGGWAARSSRAA